MEKSTNDILFELHFEVGDFSLIGSRIINIVVTY